MGIINTIAILSVFSIWTKKIESFDPVNAKKAIECIKRRKVDSEIRRKVNS